MPNEIKLRKRSQAQATTKELATYLDTKLVRVNNAAANNARTTPDDHAPAAAVANNSAAATTNANTARARLLLQ